jgi:hypothetical protein
MGGLALKRPSLKFPKIDLPRPTRWDWAAVGTLLAGLALIGVSLFVSASKAPGEPFPDGLTRLLAIAQLIVACGGLMLLGKTAKEGTGLGNLASIGAMLVGMSGVLLAAALWAAA